MKLYKKEIKPMIDPPALQGFNCHAYEVEGYDEWFPEAMEEELRSKIVVKDSWSKLIFWSRYVEVNNEELDKR